uniref:Uncharacterized protein n=1 Tax=Pyropia pulchra TaxID=60925 RepID=A0A141SF14_9RHOD|nr:hypothetical protein Ppul_021 [Pyropia pulchra]AMK96882.1 hypothetical protein Ppul_021 [Pyropia pulchra]
MSAVLVSVIFGLILIIISPFFVLLRKPLTSFFFIISLTGLTAILAVTIKKNAQYRMLLREISLIN